MQHYLLFINNYEKRAFFFNLTKVMSMNLTKSINASIMAQFGQAKEAMHHLEDLRIMTY